MPLLPTEQKSSEKNKVGLTILITALGYFVDIYDLVLFSIVRVDSLKGLNVPKELIMSEGMKLINLQMIGMLVGGIIFGVLGDKKGRVSVLFGSILLYSLANIANGFVTSLSSYGILRFLAGIGLAGELGAAITLVSEIMDRSSRGIGTAIVASVGICGAIAASWVASWLSWQMAYIVGGFLGLLLLISRLSILDSSVYQSIAEDSSVKRGSFLQLFSSWYLFKKYLCCIFIGMPLWFVVGVLVTFSPEIGLALGISSPLSAGSAIMYTYAGLAIGDLLSGLISQYLKSRKKTLALFLFITAILIVITLQLKNASDTDFYTMCFVLGLSAGYWAIFVTVAAEQFGTNLRATVAITVPNFVRAAVVPMTFLTQLLKTSFSLETSVLIIGMLAVGSAFAALSQLEESFGKDLSYVEI